MDPHIHEGFFCIRFIGGFGQGAKAPRLSVCKLLIAQATVRFDQKNFLLEIFLVFKQKGLSLRQKKHFTTAGAFSAGRRKPLIKRQNHG